MNSVFRRALPTPSGITAAALAAAALLTGCDNTDETTEEPPAGEQIDAEVAVLENSTASDDPDVPQSAPPAIAETPIDIGVLAGWQATQARDGDDEPRDPNAVELPEPAEDMSYVSWLGETGCHSATEATLWRDGDDLGVEVEAPGDPDVNCEVLNRAYVQFEVPSEAVEGAETVNGVEVSDATGPGELVETVDLGQAWEMPSDAPDQAALRWDDDAALTEWSEAIADSDGDDADAATTALESAPDSGEQRYAFLQQGCAGDDAALVVAPKTISGEIGQPPECEQQSFVLSIFDIDESLVNDEMTPMLHGRPA